MLCIKSHITDPYFNLAAEEYLLKNFKEDFFSLWRNEPSIVVGKHQNALAEIDLRYTRENGFKVARRISGGGTVFHDLGNLNFSFISSGEEGKLVNYRKFAMPVVEVLKKLGINASFSKRDDILIRDMKISGNASHVYKNRVLHHGTLLFSSDLSDLSGALRNHPERYQDKAVKSVRSNVCNISDHLQEQMSVLEFRDLLMTHVLGAISGSKLYSFSENDILEITRMKEERFSTWEWNFGYSPKYMFKNELVVEDGVISVEMKVVSGMIEELFIQNSFKGRTEMVLLERILTGARHDPFYISQRIDEEKETFSQLGISAEQVEKLLF